MKTQIKIFLVDDDLFCLNIYRQYLENIGYENLSLFLKEASCLNNLHQKPKIIFLDHNMGDLTGFDVLKKIKKHDRSIFVIILSEQKNIKVAIDALNYGAFDYILKGDDEMKKIENIIARIETIQTELIKINRPL